MAPPVFLIFLWVLEFCAVCCSYKETLNPVWLLSLHSFPSFPNKYSLFSLGGSAFTGPVDNVKLLGGRGV